MHHDVLCEVLTASPPDAAELTDVAGAASEFLIEVLASWDMAQRGLPRAP